jgi:hypothetical protein
MTFIITCRLPAKRAKRTNLPFLAGVLPITFVKELKISSVKELQANAEMVRFGATHPTASRMLEDCSLYRRLANCKRGYSKNT